MSAKVRRTRLGDASPIAINEYDTHVCDIISRKAAEAIERQEAKEKLHSAGTTEAVCV